MNQDQKQENSPEMTGEEADQVSIDGNKEESSVDEKTTVLNEVEELGVDGEEESLAGEESDADSSGDAKEEAAVTESVVEDNMAEMDMEALLSATDSSFESVSEGQIVPGIIVSISSDEVLVDIGFKSEGIISTSEFETDDEGKLKIGLGDEIEVYVVRKENLDGQVELSKSQADVQRAWNRIAQAFNENEVVSGTLNERVKGGMSVEVDGLRGFLPASQIELRAVPDLDDYIGKTLDMRVVKFNRRRDNIVLSRRILLEEAQDVKKTALLERIETGKLIKGIVKSIAPFGVFVDLDGIDGLLHRSDMSWGKVNHPSEMLAIGDEVETLVIDVDQENERISLGLKQKTTDPWLSVPDKYPVDTIVKGDVVNIVSYGAFVEIEDGVEGLIHVSEMSWTQRNVALSKIVGKGDTVEARVLSLDSVGRRISLSLKQLAANPWELLESKYPKGTRLSGVVKNLTKFGAFVEIEPGIDGLVHTSDFSWTERNVVPSQILKKGDEVDVVVLEINSSEQRISLSIKHNVPDPWEEVTARYKRGSTVQGQVVNLTDFGAFVKLEEGVEGLIHISELADYRVNRPNEVVSVGDQLDLKVIEINPDKHRIGLSLRRAKAEEGGTTVREPAKVREPSNRQYEPVRRRSRPAPVVHEKPNISDEPTSFGSLLQQTLGRTMIGSQEEE
ncbi:30S ribosomal protein S1 [Candidatus Poribacteria bacterium]|nr:30S ribosomal protein S1 [Candidatus Poribacteria bacterium]OUT63008.1 MAG: 30S ribosomal protein S1 [bacterium TMED15]